MSISLFDDAYVAKELFEVYPILVFLFIIWTLNCAVWLATLIESTSFITR